ncbi:putative lanthionine synthetase C, six-hairpin glycosidase-like superfamily [Helianthus anomalus]
MHPSHKLPPLTFKNLTTPSTFKTQMADRFFPQNMPEFIQEQDPPPPETTTTPLLSLPYNSFSDQLKQASFNLKQTIVVETWGNNGERLNDYRVYTGALGTAFLVFKAYQVSHNKKDLDLCKDIVKACHSASSGSSRVTFLCGLAGVYALGAVVAKQANDDNLCDYYLTRFREIKIPKDLPNELLYGRAGYLWACLFLNKNLGQNTISSTHMRTITDEIMRSGRRLRTKECPLMYEWHGKRYWGAAHGLVGIMHVLMSMVLTEDELKDVKGTILYMIKNRFPSGNYPSSEGSESDRLVHWCHGAPGVALTLAKAAKVFGDEEFYKAAVEAGEVVWKRGLLKRVGICHGISGNTYVFLALYRLTGDIKFLYRAKAFAAFLYEKSRMLISQGVMHGGDNPFSLFEGVGGMAYLFMDMVEPLEARFPAYEL